ncbi:hypothetical protein AX16_005975 [Volvariella volvacea WC 439]|nr:hypothetical protein AX16_005975 [Volvariella volvacea WC 439]
MDKSLDEIITANKAVRQKRGSTRRHSAGGAARAQVLGNPTTSPAQRARVAATNTSTKAAAAAVAAQPATQQPADKIIVSNLPVDVNEAQIKELFHSTIGPLRDVTLHYDASGRSKGVASVHFQRRGDGNRAYQSYNNRLVDGS